MVRKAIVLGAILACVCTSYGDDPGPKEVMTGFVRECRKEHQIEPSKLREALRLKKLPETENGKCFLACVMKKIGMIKDGKLDIEKCLELNKIKFTDPESLEKANEITKTCAEVKAPDGSDCTLAVEISKCAVNKAMELKLQVPHEQDKQD